MWLVAVAEGAFSDTLSASLFAFPLYIAVICPLNASFRSTQKGYYIDAELNPSVFFSLSTI